METLRKSISYFGTDDFAVTVLERLYFDPRFNIIDVVTPPDAPSGRGQKMNACPVKKFALKNSISVLEDPKNVLAHPVDFIVVVVYGRILPQKILDHPKYASLNVHPSLLPKYRGPSPVRAALLNGDTVTGVSVMGMEAKLDTGPVYAFSEFAISPQHQTESLKNDLAKLAAELLAQTLPGISEGTIEALPQDDSMASYCPKISRESGKILWKSDSALTIERKLKAYYPWPGIYTTFAGKRLKILKGHATLGSVKRFGLTHALNDLIWVDTKNGRFILEEVQIEGKKPVSIFDFVRGYRDFADTVLGA